MAEYIRLLGPLQARITTWNFLPFLLSRVGAAAVWLVNSLMVAWTVGLALLARLWPELARSWPVSRRRRIRDLCCPRRTG